MNIFEQLGGIDPAELLQQLAQSRLKKSARGNYWVKVRDTHVVVFKRADQSWGARIQRDGCRAKYLKTTSDYPHYLLDAIEAAFGKPRDLDNRKALVDFTIDDFDEALARDPMVVAARLEEERDRANGFACGEADV
jgi:hypothetical protein